MVHPDPEFQERGMAQAELGTRKRIAEILQRIAEEGRLAQELYAWLVANGRTKDFDEIVQDQIAVAIRAAESAILALEARS
jgi:hypothetical protein